MDRRFGAGFLAAELMFVTTHYAALLLPLHTLILLSGWRGAISPPR